MVSEPRFHVGRHVAVCTRSLLTVIPVTTVIAVTWYSERVGIRPDASLWVMPTGYYYKVSDADHWIFEQALRPINPDTEYQETTENEEIEA